MMKKKKVYIAGKISGLEYNETEDKFFNAVLLLNSQYRVVNPIWLCSPQWGWSRCMVRCISHLISCHAIYLLADWNKSKGARIEVFIAILMNKEILKQE